MSATSTEPKEEARAALRDQLTPGDTLYTILRHVSQSGMSRGISVIAIENGVPYDISYKVARALGSRLVDAGGSPCIRVRGCGMDMGFHLVYELATALYHGTPEAERYRQENERPNMSASPGYMLNHRWL